LRHLPRHEAENAVNAFLDGIEGAEKLESAMDIIAAVKVTATSPRVG
jgi:hypothetical protein